MTPADQSRKLRHIASLRSLEEIQGWHMGIAARRALGGDWFSGEEDALRFRAAQIRAGKA